MDAFLRYVRRLPFETQLPILYGAINEYMEEYYLLGADAPCHALLYELRAINRMSITWAHTELRRVETFMAIYGGRQEVPRCTCTLCIPQQRRFPPIEQFPVNPEMDRNQAEVNPAAQAAPAPQLIPPAAAAVPGRLADVVPPAPPAYQPRANPRHEQWANTINVLLDDWARGAPPPVFVNDDEEDDSSDDEGIDVGLPEL